MLHKKLVVASADGFFMSTSKLIDATISKYKDISMDEIYKDLNKFKTHFRVHKKAFETSFLPNTKTYIDDFVKMLTGIESLILSLPSDAHILGAVDSMKQEILSLINIARKSVNR